MQALGIKVFENRNSTQIISFFDGQPINCFKLFFRQMSFCPTVDKNKYAYFQKIDCFLDFKRG